MGVMERVLRSLAEGGCILPLRQALWLPDKSGALGLMPAYWDAARTIGLKAVTFFPGNAGSDYDSHQGAVMVFDAEHGQLLAMIDATSITAIRTAAVSGVATKLLARADAGRLALLGSGVQARMHLDAMLLCRPVTKVKVWSRTPQHAEAFAQRAARQHSMRIVAARSAEDAIRGADLICTATSAKEPVLQGEWIEPGAHINAVGSSVAFARELDGRAIQRSRLFVDRRESALNEAGDFLLAKKEGLVGDGHILGEIGELLVGKAAGRTSDNDITLFKSVGLAVEDLASGLHVYQAAVQKGIGSRVEWGGNRHAPD